MKALHTKTLQTFVERFSNFKDAEIRSCSPIDPQTISITLAVQDSARAFDWITITLVFTEVSDARLLDENRLGIIDMRDGASLLYDEDLFAFGLGECYNIKNTKSASCYIIANAVKYEEGLF